MNCMLQLRKQQNIQTLQEIMSKTPKNRSFHTKIKENKHFLHKGSGHLDQQKDLIIIEQKQLIFSQSSSHQTQEQELCIRNHTNNLVKIKIYGPKSPVFYLKDSPLAETLSAGLTIKVKVYFYSQQIDDFYDQIKIVCQDKLHEVPIRAVKTEIAVTYDDLISGGTIGMNMKHKFTNIFKNTSKKPAKIKLIKDNFETLYISPDQFLLNEQEEKVVSFFVTPSAAGVFRHRLLVQADSTILKAINITYSSTQFRFFLANQEGNKVTEYDMGNVYYGQKKSYPFYLVNNTPDIVHIKSKIRLGWKFNESALQSPQQLAIQCSSTIINIEPNVMSIKPFSRQEVILSCQSEVTQEIERKVNSFAKRDSTIDTIQSQVQKIKMGDNEYHETLIIEYAEKKMYCSLKATCIYPMVKISPVFLDFGLIGIKQTVSAKLKIENHKDLPIKIFFPKPFSFEIFPNIFTVAPYSQNQAQIFLTPVSFGDFTTSITCMISQCFKVQIPVSYRTKNIIKRHSSSSHLEERNALKSTMNLISLAKQAQNKIRSKEDRLFNSFKTQSKKLKKIRYANISGCQNTINRLETSNQLNLVNNKNNHYSSLEESSEKLIHEIKQQKIPRNKDPLFVTRKIDKYSPYNTSHLKIKNQSAASASSLLHQTLMKSRSAAKGVSLPKNPLKKEYQIISRELPIEALRNIEVTEKVIHFGKVFIHSRIIRQFEIINNNDFNLQVKLSSAHQFLQESQLSPKIIPAKTKSKFKVVLRPKECGQFQSLIEYTINSVHSFRFLVQAEVELVTLNISKSNLKMIYQDDTKDMHLSDYFDLRNEGNTDAYFSIEHTASDDLFKIEPKEGKLHSNESITISVLYNSDKKEVIPAGEPKNIKQFNKNSFLTIDERLIVKVKHGLDMYIRVQSSIAEPKCFVKENKINFGCCIVPKGKSKSFILRNLSRSICLYEIDSSSCQNLLTFDTMIGKVLPESSKQIVVTYQSNLIHQVSMFFRVIIRGGLVINVPFIAESIAPKISIVEDSFNFGQICCGTTGILPISIRNQSQTVIQLLLDLLNHHSQGIEYLNAYLDPCEKDQKIPLEKCHRIPQIYKLKIQSKTIYKFYLLYQPKIPGYYQFELPLYIENLIKNDSIIKMVKCYAKEPKFFFEPSIIKFKKKIINDKDNACFHPLVQFVTFKNPSHNLLKWKIQLPKLQNGKKLCFEIETRKGEIKSKSWQCINIFFNPYEPGFYDYKFPLLVYNWEKGEYIQEAEIKVEGQGQYPLLLFDRRQLILPVVPLNVESVGMFKIINEGYETIDIKHNIQSLDEMISIPEIVLFYPQGSRMGVNKKELYVIVKFSSKKPVSFTVKLQIDDGSRSYELPISGTADNSIFTVFPYLSDKQNLYKLETNNDTILLKNIDTRNIFDRLHNYYEQISQSDYSLPCQIIRRWINTLLKDERVIHFPQDLVQSNDILLKFLYKLTNKKELEKAPAEYLQNQQKFYEYIIRILKSMGCLLNHIRPYYLLGKTDFMAIFQQNEYKHMNETYRKYNVIHLDSWIILFYQAISNFWYNPQKLKLSYTEGIKSNIYSPVEINVLKWIKKIYQQYNEGDEHKFVDFNRDFKDSLASIYALYHFNFLNKAQSLQGINKHIVSNSDYVGNCRALYTLLTKANLIPLISQDEYLKIKQKQMFLFMYQLYESLPQQVPKTAPILFICELGQKCTKYIQIKNPSNKAINYWIKIQGSQDYFPEDKQSIRIQPKSCYKLGIEFRSRVSQEQVAFLMLFNKKETDGGTSGIGCSLVFQLRSQIVGRKSIKKLQNLRCQMYETVSIKIPVQNNFNDKEYGNFKINILEELYESKAPCKVFNFFVEVESIKIRRNTSSSLELTYHPMILEPIRCYIIFCDPNVGQFQYEVIGIPQVPKPLQQLKITNPVYINTQQNIQLSLPVYNNFMIKSLSMMEQKMQFFKATGRSGKYLELLNSDLHENEESSVFKVQINMDPKILQLIKFPSESTIFHRKKSKSEIRNRLKIQCNFNIIIKDLILDFVLISQDKKDVRRFKAQLNVTSQPIVNNLVMKTNARTPLVQQIPIENTTNKDWKINLSISDYENPDFSLKANQICVSRDIICKKNTKVSTQLIYNPLIISQNTAKLTITNQITSQQIIYLIKSVSTDPLSEDHLYFSTFTGKSNLHKISISNPYPEAITYYIQTDLPEIECPTEIVMEPEEKIQFSMIISANNPGIFIGYLKFVELKTGKYFWYSVTIEAEDEVVFEENIKLEAMIDKEVEKVFEFKNSLSKPITYRVDYDDYHGISGQKSFDVKPYSTYLYRLKFKPKEVINEEGSMRIFCPEKGAHIYKIQLISHEHFKRQLQPLKVEVGRTGYREIKLSEIDTSSKLKKLDLNFNLSNPNFSIESDLQNTLHNMCAEEAGIRIIYKPVCQGSQKCIIKILDGNKNVTKVYEIEGIGIAPFTVQTVEFQSIDFKPILEIIKFKNPYQGASQTYSDTQFKNQSFYYQKVAEIQDRCDTFQVSIQSNALQLFNFVGYPEHWESKLKSNDILAIPIEFKPISQGYFQSMLTVQADHYKWQYLLKGTCFNEHLNHSHFDEQIVTKTRCQGIKVVNFELPGFFKQHDLWPNKVKISHKDESKIKTLRDWLKIKIETNYTSHKQICKAPNSESNETHQIVTLYVRFRPNKPIQEIITLSIYSQMQASIKIDKKVRLIAEPPEPQDKIQIQITSIKQHIFILPIQLESSDLENCSARLEKGQFLQAKIVGNNTQVKFLPNNCTFKNNIYGDLLIVESEDEYRSYEIVIKLKNKELGRSNKQRV